MFNHTVLVIGLALWAGQFYVAGAFGWLTGRQMRRQFPGKSILPLLWHGGIWYDFPLTFYLAYLAQRHPEWEFYPWTGCLVLGYAASWYMHTYVYAPATQRNPDPTIVVTQEAHTQNGKVSAVGWLHEAFFGMMFGIVILEYVFSKRVIASELWTTSAFLVGLVFVGNHMVLGIIKALTGKPRQYRASPLTSRIGWTTVIGCAIAATAAALIRLHFM